MDIRGEQAQRLFWEISELRRMGQDRAAIPKLRRMAHLHEQIGLDMLMAQKADGWIDFYAAITAWAQAGDSRHSSSLIVKGKKLASSFPDGLENICAQLDDLVKWMASLRTIPALGDFARPLPSRPMEAA
jgi:hypothetical protein